VATRRQLKEQVAEATRDHAAGRTLAQILEIPDRERFMLALDHYACRPGLMTGWSLPDILPHLRPGSQTVLLLNAFTSAMFSGGIGQFITEYREFFEQVVKSCETIGALRAVEYLNAAGRCFPDGTLPSTTDDCAVLESDTEDCLRDLDARYKDAYEEVIDRLRSYVIEHPDRFEGAP
jgi:hypothetical protein